MRNEIDKKGIFFFFVKLGLALSVAFTLPKEAIHSADFTNALITIFSVFAGFMIALMGLTAYLNEESQWKEMAVKRENIEAKLLRQELLFYGYLFTLTLIIVSLLVAHYSLWGHAESIANFLRRFYTFIGLLTLFYSFTLPRSLRKAHEKVINDKIKGKKG